VTTTTHSYARSIALHEEAQEALAGGVNSNFRLGSHPVPLFFTRGAGAHLWDVDGNEYIDYVLGMGPNILGHAPPDVVEAVAETLSRGNLFAGQHEDEVALARLVQQTVPCAELVRFGLSGSEMDQAAIRLSRAATGRKKIVKFEGHYHGWFDTVLVSTAPPLAEAGPEESPSPHFPSAGQSRAAAADIAILPWNNLDILTHYVEAHADEIAGILMEPILINTCVIVPRPGYLEGVRALCDRHGIVLIFDEVITGFRVALGGAQARLGVTPDLAVFAKAIGGGYPVAAIAGKRRYMELLGGPVLHGGSYNGNTVSTTASLATLAHLIAGGEALYAEMDRRGTRLMDGLRAVAAEAATPLHVQGIGAAFNTAFGAAGPVTDYRSYARTDIPTQKRWLVALQNHGVRVTSRGTWFLSAAHTDADIDRTLEAARAALADIAAG
jgi:glutamate-1-semialdehyde 2,1-aminomutase